MKFGVEQLGTHPTLWYALGVLDILHKEAFREPIEVTSMKDGTHMPGSLHPLGLAADIRTRNHDADSTKAFAGRALACLFPLGFDVILETDHLHVEYDPKPGRQLLTFSN